MSHTPGPWKWWTSNSFLRLSSEATGKDGDVIDSYKLSDGHTTVCVKNKSDMALIAAAPELLEALESLFENYKMLADSGDAGNWRLEDEPAGMTAMAAIAKARGHAAE
ncbi:hypothetical protein C3369_07100 [Escherichia sp. ESNIH1]|uniref:hypothetical protein n=1 Tax=Escherichia sp. ESNIH1 TaxID=1985876 RepID=UPI000CDD1A53|nr:hypothetical protein [Escherichia sp. ESNIH1]POU03581.1 hypothetical protein C3369_07100 [Escherichia sp. ESNIH1]